MQTLGPVSNPESEPARAQGPRELVCMLQLEKHCFRDDSQGLHFAGRGILRPRGEEGFAGDHTASAGNKASESGSRAFLPVSFMSTIVPRTNVGSTRMVVTSLPATVLASALGTSFRN